MRRERELDLTENEILTALEQARQRPVIEDDPPGAMTPRDIAAASGLTVKTVCEWIRKLKDSGVEFEIVTVTRLNIYDQPYPTKAFILKSDED